MRRTSSSTATSPTAARASPPPCRTRATVSAAAAASMSHTTIRAPSEANRSDASHPMPLPAPVIRTTLPASRPLMRVSSRIGCETSDALEQPDQLPVGHGLLEGGLLEPGQPQVVVDHLHPERLPGHARAPELVDRLAERLRHLRELGVLVRVALVERRWAEPRPDPVQAGCD